MDNTSSSLNNPLYTYSDGTKLYVGDPGAGYVLVWNTIPTADQAENFHLTAAASIGAPVSVYSKNSKLYVSDIGNSQVLIWNTIPTADVAADTTLTMFRWRFQFSLHHLYRREQALRR